MRFDLVLGGAILLLVLISNEVDKWRTSVEIAKRLNRFLIYIFISLPLVTWPGSVIRLNLVEWIKVALFYVFIVTIVRTEQQLKWIIYVFLACQLFRIIEPLYLHITTGYWGDIAYSHVGGRMQGLDRLSGAPHDVVNPNQLAWVIVTIVPFMFYLFWMGGRFGKIISCIAVPPIVYCLLLTGSRSGLLCLVFTIISIIMLSKDRLKYFIVAIIIILPVAVYFSGSLSVDMQTRYLSLIDSNVAGADTAQGRINASIKQIGSLSNNPLFGNGLGTSRETNWNVLGGSSQITHNLYIEILQETGLIGFSLFMLIICSIIKCLREAMLLLNKYDISSNDWLVRLIYATRVWVYMQLFYSLSCFGLRSWEWYFFGGVGTLCLLFARLRGDTVQVTS